MVQLDERILEYLDAEGWGSPRVMVRRFRFTASPRRVAARCERLREAGFVEPLVEGGRQYELSVWGKRYLDGELDARNHGPASRFSVRPIGDGPGGDDTASARAGSDDA